MMLCVRISYSCCDVSYIHISIFRIDGEMRRLNHKHISEAEFLLKQQQWSQMEPTLPSNFDFEDDYDRPLSATGGPTQVPGFTSGVDRSVSSPRRRKDEKMVEDDPMRYCADRCVTTGNCDVFEVRGRKCW